MNAYLRGCTLFCESCARRGPKFIASNEEQFVGPYPSGGGEADSPQHCDSCGIWLQNPLTDDGRRYVEDAIAAARDRLLWGERQNMIALTTWAPGYGLGGEK